jgi:hypothetical protein
VIFVINQGIWSVVIGTQKIQTQIEGQKKCFDEQNFSSAKERNEWKPWKTWALKSRQFHGQPLLDMQFCKTQDL